jgi:hypothetical protein
MAKYLAIFSDSLDEIEINGFVVMTKKEMEDYEELANSITWSFSYQIDNQELEYTCGEDLLSMIDFREISNEEAHVFKRVFNDEFGLFISEEELHMIIGEEDSDDEDLDDEDDEDYESDY